MITLTGINGRTEFVAAENIARITEAGPSSQWHGIRSFVRLFDGAVIEAQETSASIKTQVEAHVQAKPQGDGE